MTQTFYRDDVLRVRALPRNRECPLSPGDVVEFQMWTRNGFATVYDRKRRTHWTVEPSILVAQAAWSPPVAHLRLAPASRNVELEPTKEAPARPSKVRRRILDL